MNKKNKHKSLQEFIKEFFWHAKTKKRTNKNTSAYITKTINNTFVKHFNIESNFNQNEIIKAFEEQGASTLMPNESKVYGETSNGLVEFSKCHILIDIPKLDKLTFANRKSYPPNTSSKKIEEWNNLRANLKEFKNSYLTEVIS